MTHEEETALQAGYACACGETFPAPEDLDDHFFAVFTPADDIGTDGKVHAEVSRDHGWRVEPGAALWPTEPGGG